jgi:formylglycine-generating enzyme
MRGPFDAKVRRLVLPCMLLALPGCADRAARAMRSVAAPSCATAGPGTNNCGPGGSGTESCCTSLQVSGGTYYRSYDPIAVDGGVELASDGGPTAEADPATVSSFRLDKYLVTVGRFRQFVGAWNAGYMPPAGSGKHTHLNGGSGVLSSTGFEPGWNASDNSKLSPTSATLACDPTYKTWGTYPTDPINCVTWLEAYAFCIWDGGFLPTEAEYEYAAAGGSLERQYAWGTAAPGTANQYAIYQCDYPNSSGMCSSLQNLAPVGTAALGAGLWGQLDLTSNIFAWTLDTYDIYVGPCTDCANIASAPGTNRVARGALFNGDATLLPPTYRTSYAPTARLMAIGIRCARTP